MFAHIDTLLHHSLALQASLFASSFSFDRHHCSTTFSIGALDDYSPARRVNTMHCLMLNSSFPYKPLYLHTCRDHTRGTVICDEETDHLVGRTGQR